MALVICRRYPGRFCGTSPCSKLPGRTCEDYTLTVKKINTDRMTASLKSLKPLKYQTFCNPVIYSATQSILYWNMGSSRWYRGQDHPAHSGPCHPARRMKNIGGTTSSQRLLTTSSTLWGLGFHKASASKASTLQLGLPETVRADEEDVEVFDSFKDTRLFLQLRPEYQLHSHSNSETCQPLSISESKLILLKVKEYQNKLPRQTIVDYFCKLSTLPTEQHPVLLSSASFALLCQLSVKNIRFFDIPDLISILKAFVNLEIPHSHPVLNVFETRFSQQVWEMSLDQLLLVADLWRCLGRKAPRFFKIFFSYLNLHWKDLSLSQLIHLIYVIGENRQVPQDLMQKLELLILKYIDLINLEEVGTICLGFFKSSSNLSEFVMEKIGDLACADMHHLSSHALVHILKMFRFTHVDHVNFMKRFVEIAPQRIRPWGSGVMHLTLACIMNAVAASLPPRVVHCRSKDVAKILWSFGTLNYKPPNTEEFYSCLIREIHRKMPEFNQYPEHLLTCLLGLAFSEYFPAELIDVALSPGFVRLAQETSKFQLTKELYTLDGTVGIECPDYKGNRLGSHLQQEASVYMWELARKDMNSKPEFLEALTFLEIMLGGPQYVKHHMILPHTRSSDLEVQLDVNMNPIPFNSEAIPSEDKASLKLKRVGVSLTDDLMNQLLKGKAKRHFQTEIESETGQCPMKLEKTAVPLGSNLCDVANCPGAVDMTGLYPPLHVQAPQMKLAIQFTHRNQYCYGTRNLLGLHNMKRRQLVRLGYHVIELPHWEWFPLLKQTRSEKLAFLHEKVFASVL
uniref:FAST kinase domains 5 n=1 Tax=Cavia porcellus TaxID=10141 RepID=H0W5V6_CAVPO